MKPSIYEYAATAIGKLVAEKNISYGDSFARSGEILSILFPDGIKPEQYTDMLAITRIIDKLFRIASDKGAYGETPYQDIAGYAILGVVKETRNPVYWGIDLARGPENVTQEPSTKGGKQSYET